MKTHISIMAHAEAKDTFKRHFPYWSAQVPDVERDMLVWFPENSTFEIGGIQSMQICKKEHHGVEAIKRFRYMLEHLNGLGYDRYIFHEYDSISLEPFSDQSLGDIAGNFFEGGDTGGFNSPIYPHPPLVFSKTGLAKVVAEFRDMPWEKGVWDRWLGLIVHRSGMSWHSFLKAGTGFAFNTIHPEHFPLMHKAIMAGAVHLHGVKDEEALKAAQRSYERYRTLMKAKQIEAEEAGIQS